MASHCHLMCLKARQDQKVAKNGKTIAENMENPQYEKRVIINEALKWEDRYRKENHMVQICDEYGKRGEGLFSVEALQPMWQHDGSPEQQELNFNGLSDVEKLIIELHYGFGRGEGNELTIEQIARRLKHGEKWVRIRHTHALEVLRTNLS